MSGTTPAKSSTELLAPAGYANHPNVLREIGVGYDGSPESKHALAVARELAATRRGKLSAFKAVSIPAGFFASGAGTLGETIPNHVEQARAQLAALGGVEPHAAYGMVAEELALYSASLDLLVIGSRGYGPIGRLAHGSISRKLARTARCPLIVLTRATAVEEAPNRTETAYYVASA